MPALVHDVFEVHLLLVDHLRGGTIREGYAFERHQSGKVFVVMNDGIEGFDEKFALQMLQGWIGDGRDIPHYRNMLEATQAVAVGKGAGKGLGRPSDPI